MIKVKCFLLIWRWVPDGFANMNCKSLRNAYLDNSKKKKNCSYNENSNSSSNNNNKNSKITTTKTTATVAAISAAAATTTTTITVMVCPSVNLCGAHAYCAPLEDSYTCMCNSGYNGDGFKGCKKDEGLEEKYVLVIVFVILLVVGLVATALFLHFRRKIKQEIDRAKLMAQKDSSGWRDPYTNKWRIMLADTMSSNLPKKNNTAYTIKKEEGLGAERSVVEADEDYEEDGRKGTTGKNKGYIADPDDLDLTINYIEGMEENF